MLINPHLGSATTFLHGSAPTATRVAEPWARLAPGAAESYAPTMASPDDQPLLPSSLVGMQGAEEAPRSSLARLATKVMAVGMLASSVLTGLAGCSLAGQAERITSATTISAAPSLAGASAVSGDDHSVARAAERILPQVTANTPHSDFLFASGTTPGAAPAATPRVEFRAPIVQDMPQRPLMTQDTVYRQLQEHTLAQTPQKAEQPARTYPTIKVQKGDYVSHRVNYSTLITDEEFTDSKAMSAQQLQAFFEDTGSFLADYKEGGRTAAQIIDQAAKAHEINPRVILATLQKENGMVSRSVEPKKWVMRSAMGYAYDDGGSTAGKHSTFAYQIDKGTELLHELFEEGKQVNFPAKMVVDYGTRRLPINNAATWSLMRYTPHTRDTHLRQIGGGNHSFHHVMERLDRQMVRADPG